MSQRNKGKQVAESSFDNYRFRSQLHEDCFNLIVSKKKIIPEVGFHLAPTELPEIQSEIQRRNWQLLNEPQESGLLLTQEFYSNAWEGTEETDKPSLLSYVRGTEVNFSARNIRRVLQLGPRSTNQKDYMWRLENDPRLDDVLRDICNEGVQWKKDGRGEPSLLKRWDLIPVARGWLEFVQHNILPTSNVSDVIVSRAVLIHCIMEGTEVNVAGIISDSIHSKAQNLAMRGKLGYPGLIKRLCEAANTTVEEDIQLEMRRPITLTVMTKEIRRQRQDAGEEQQQPLPPPDHSNEEAAAPTTNLCNNQDLDAPISRRELLMFRNEVNHKLDYLTAAFQYVHQDKIPLFHQTPWTARRFDGTVDTDDPRYPFRPQGQQSTNEPQQEQSQGQGAGQNLEQEERRTKAGKEKVGERSRGEEEGQQKQQKGKKVRPKVRKETGK